MLKSYDVYKNMLQPKKVGSYTIFLYFNLFFFVCVLICVLMKNAATTTN